MHKRPIQEVKEKGNHTVHSALPLSRQLKRSSVMICELSDVSMTSPCSSLTPIRCSLLYLSLHPQNSSCQFMSWQTLRPASKKPPHSFFLLFYCPSVKIACSLTTPLPFSHFFPLPLSLSLTPFTDLLPKESATSNCCCCRSLPGWPTPNASALVGAKSHGLLLSPGPRQEKPNQYQQALPLQTQRDDVLEHVCECLSVCVCVCVCVCERERERSRLGTQGVWIQLRHKSQELPAHSVLRQTLQH